MCDIQTHHGRGPFHVLCVPGLVPDGAETFLHQLPLLRRFGPVSLVTYPYERFVLDDVITSLVNELKRMVLSGRRVVLVGVSVGGGICLEMLRRLHEADRVAAEVDHADPGRHFARCPAVVERLERDVVPEEHQECADRDDGDADTARVATGRHDDGERQRDDGEHLYERVEHAGEEP